MIIISLIFITIGIIKNDISFLHKTNTYGNYDTPGTESWVMKLQPGVEDHASSIRYGEFHRKPLIVIGILFFLTIFLSVYKLKKEIILRKITQWLMFVVARLGVLRVSGLCGIKRSELGAFPFLNCQACEMATGACPIGMLQWGLMRQSGLYLVLGTMLFAGTVAGRLICGWLCPFGFISDLLDRISIRKFKIPKIFNYFKYIVLIFVFTAFLWEIPIFCAYLCQSGSIYGRLPYYLTTGLSALKEAFSSYHWLKTVLLLQVISLLILIIGAILVSGRWFCRYVCPLGALYGLCNYISPIKVVHDQSKCTNCNACIKKCPMEVDLRKSGFTDVTNCIKCGKCTKLCEARHFSIGLKDRSIQAEESEETKIPVEK